MKAGVSVRKQCKRPSKTLMLGARIVVEGISEKWLNWDYILKATLLIFANALDIGCERKATAMD